MSASRDILDFWENKQYYKTPEVLKAKAREFYTEEFINNYSKWADNVKTLNETMEKYFMEKHFPMKHWEVMPYNWFCEKMNALVEEWISANSDILVEDVPIILEKLIADYISVIITNYQKHAYSINTLLDSIKNTVVL